MSAFQYQYGRLLSDFETGKTYEHPWEVTIDGGAVALFQASFLDAMPLFASKVAAQKAGFTDRPLHPLLCLNLALSFSVHDVSEQAIAHLAYLDVRFPEPGYIGDTVSARSTVIDSKPSSSGDKGVVHVRTALTNEKGHTLCVFERKALIRGGALAARPAQANSFIAREAVAELSTFARIPASLANATNLAPARYGALFEDFAADQVFLHEVGKTVGESEHMQLTFLLRNSHPLHFDELYCKEKSFTKTRVVYGGLVFGWIASLTSRDLASNGLWEVGFDEGAHPNGTIGGDTLYAASKVLSVKPSGNFGEVTFRLVGVKNLTSRDAYERYGDALFEEELLKDKTKKIKDKVFEITRTLLVRRRA